MTNNQNKGEKKCRHNIFVDGVCVLCPTPKSGEKDTNSQDSIQVGNESIQTVQSPTLGTTMEDKNLQEILTDEIKTILKMFQIMKPENEAMFIAVALPNLHLKVHELLSQAKAETQIEHCSEPNCPECNLVAYNKGKEDGKAETIKECVEKIKKEYEYADKTWKSVPDKGILINLLIKDIE